MDVTRKPTGRRQQIRVTLHCARTELSGSFPFSVNRVRRYCVTESESG